MKSIHSGSLLRSLASLKLALALMTMFAVAIAVATFVEVRYGAVGAQVVVYKARWFEVILAAMVLNVGARIVHCFPWGRRRIAFLLIHVGVIVILLSAFVTRYFGYEGTMSIREDSSADFMYSQQDYIQLRSGGEAASFPVRLYKPGAQSLARTLTLAGEDWRVEVVHFWTHYQQSWAAGEGGTPMLDLVLMNEAGERPVALTRAGSERLGELRLRLMADEQLPTGGDEPLGALRVRLDGLTYHVPIPDRIPLTVEKAGYTFVFTEWQADFKVGRGSDDPAAGHAGKLSLINPMVRVNITDSQGRGGERILFAWHPEFSMGHSGSESDMEDVDLLYELNRGIDFALDNEGVLSGRTTLALSEIDAGDGRIVRKIAAGEEFAVMIGALYRDQVGGTTFLLRDFLPSAVLQPLQRDDGHGPAGIRVRVSSSTGESEEVFISKFESAGRRLSLCDGELVISFGPVRIDLPYSLHLDDFEMETYPGSDNPAAYRSHVRLYDEELGIDGRPETIFMNNPLVHRGSRHYQSSYDQDQLGTVLSVNHDPGTWPTYCGYFIISLGFLYSLVKRAVGRRPRREARRRVS